MPHLYFQKPTGGRPSQSAAARALPSPGLAPTSSGKYSRPRGCTWTGGAAPKPPGLADFPSRLDSWKRGLVAWISWVYHSWSFTRCQGPSWALYKGNPLSLPHTFEETDGSIMGPERRSNLPRVTQQAVPQLLQSPAVWLPRPEPGVFPSPAQRVDTKTNLNNLSIG